MSYDKLLEKVQDLRLSAVDLSETIDNDGLDSIISTLEDLVSDFERVSEEIGEWEEAIETLQIGLDNLESELESLISQEPAPVVVPAKLDQIDVDLMTRRIYDLLHRDDFVQEMVNMAKTENGVVFWYAVSRMLATGVAGHVWKLYHFVSVMNDELHRS